MSHLHAPDSLVEPGFSHSRATHPGPFGALLRVSCQPLPAASTWPPLVRRDLGAAMSKSAKRLTKADRERILRDVSDETAEGLARYCEEVDDFVRRWLASPPQGPADL